MATTINDYTLEIGWSAKKVNKGIKDLEDKIQNLGKKTQTAVDPTAKQPKQTRQKKGADLDLLNARKLTLLQQTNAQLQKLRTLAAGIDLKIKGGAAAHAQMSVIPYSCKSHRNKNCFDETCFISSQSMDF